MTDRQNAPPQPSEEESAKRPFNPDGGEDEAGAPGRGDDTHLHGDQQSRSMKPEPSGSADKQPSDNNPTKVEDLTKARRDDFDPDQGQE